MGTERRGGGRQGATCSFAKPGTQLGEVTIIIVGRYRYRCELYSTLEYRTSKDSRSVPVHFRRCSVLHCTAHDFARRCKFLCAVFIQDPSHDSGCRPARDAKVVANASEAHLSSIISIPITRGSVPRKNDAIFTR